MKYGSCLAADSVTIGANDFVRIVIRDLNAKNAFLDCLMGNLKPTSGSVHFWGRENRGFHRDDIQQKVGWLVFKKEAHAPWVRVGEYLRAISGIYRHWNAELSRELVQLLDLDVSKRMNQIDLEEQTKINFVRALSFEPELLIMDELPGTISAASRAQISQALAEELGRRALTVVLVSQTASDGGMRAHLWEEQKPNSTSREISL